MFLTWGLLTWVATIYFTAGQAKAVLLLAMMGRSAYVPLYARRELSRIRLRESWETLIPRVRDMCSRDTAYLETCNKCPIVNLCMHCAAHAHLESGALDGATPYFCAVAHARAAALKE